jgi:hypothetical protein
LINKIYFYYALSVIVIAGLGFYIGAFHFANNNQSSNSTKVKIKEKIAYVPQIKYITKTITIQKNINNYLENDNFSQFPEYIDTKIANHIIDNLSLSQIEEYFTKLGATSDDFNHINNKHQFAQRVVDEFLNNNNFMNNENTSISFSLLTTIDEKNPTTFTDISNKTIYAHLSFNKYHPLLKNIFIKWQNITNGDVLLFDKKDISSMSNNNWVGFTPNIAWKKGKYKVSFYHFNNQLTPITSGYYYID